MIRASNIVIDQMLNALIEIKKSGLNLIDLEIVPEEDNPKKNKVILYPVKTISDNTIKKEDTPDLIIRNPDVDINTNDIFNLFNDIL